jgi:hypothetical protein
VKRKRRLDALETDGDDDGVTGIIPTREARADIGVGGEYVNELAFALVAPLCSEHGRHFPDCESICCWPDNPLRWALSSELKKNKKGGLEGRRGKGWDRVVVVSSPVMYCLSLCGYVDVWFCSRSRRRRIET